MLLAYAEIRCEGFRYSGGNIIMNLYKLRTRLIVVAALTILHPLKADNRILLYLRHAPTSIIEGAASDAKKSLKTPGQQANSLLQAKVSGLLRPKLGGIPALYGGYMSMSSPDGGICFPLRHTTQKVYLAITPSIQMIRLRGNTFSHRSFLPPPTPTALFSLEMQIDDKNRTYWYVKTEALPSDLVINPLTIVLLTEPNNVIVPDGSFLAAENQQLVLPDVILVSREGSETCLLNAMSFKQHFEQIVTEKKKASDTSTQSMVQNI